MNHLNAILPVAGLLIAVSGCNAAPSKTTAPSVASATTDDTRVYKKVGERELHLTLVKPPAWKATDKRPAIVLFHGGGWVSGRPVQFTPQANHFAKQGLVCVQPEYRLLDATGNEPPEFPIEDAKSAMRWVRSHAAELGIDANRIAAGGGSAGGHLAAATALIEGSNDPQDDLKVSAKPQALILFNPVLDNGPKGGYGYERTGKRYLEFSPAHNVKPQAPPTIIFQGTKDKLIPVATVKRFQTAMTKAGARCEVQFFEGKGHGFFNVEPIRTETLNSADAFLKSLGWLN